MRHMKRNMVILGCVVIGVAAWFVFCGYWWGWGPFKKVHNLKMASLPGNAKIYALQNVAPLENSLLEGKRIVFLGSSITYGEAALGISFADYIGARNNCEIVKAAVSGTTLADGVNSYFRRLKRLDKSMQVDLFVCQLSTNDTWQGKKLGTIATDEKYDTSTVAGTIQAITAYAKATWGCPVVFYTSPQFEDEQYGAMVELLNEIAALSDITVIDMWGDTTFNRISKEERELYMADHIHPTQAGYFEWWVPYMEPILIDVMRENG